MKLHPLSLTVASFWHYPIGTLCGLEERYPVQTEIEGCPKVLQFLCLFKRDLSDEGVL
jgi:hypothetical protein